MRARFSHLLNPVHFIAFGFGSGLSTRAPGTIGSAVALLFYVLFLHTMSDVAYLLWLVCASLLGVVVCSYSARALKVKDHPAIVWDEFVGMWIAVIGIPYHWEWLLTGFVLFRLLDILKPPPLRYLESLPGGVGIMLDDIVAGLLVVLIMHWVL